MVIVNSECIIVDSWINEYLIKVYQTVFAYKFNIDYCIVDGCQFMRDNLVKVIIIIFY